MIVNVQQTKLQVKINLRWNIREELYSSNKHKQNEGNSSDGIACPLTLQFYSVSHTKTWKTQVLSFAELCYYYI